MILTFDGPSGTGKSTIALSVARKLGFKYLNTGMIYRALSYYFITNNIMPNDKRLDSLVNNLNIKILFDNDNQIVHINGIDCTPFVSNKEVQQYVSKYSVNKNIREKVTSIQRDFAFNNDVVVEGRDIGSVVFPDADFKFYVTCDIEVRAKRRLKDLLALGQKTDLKQVIESLNNRDLLDSSREISPLIKPNNSIDIDTTHSTIEESVNKVISNIETFK